MVHLHISYRRVEQITASTVRKKPSAQQTSLDARLPTVPPVVRNRPQQAREQAEAARIRGGVASGNKEKSPRKNSPNRGEVAGGGGRRTPRPASRERRENTGNNSKKAQVSVPTSNDNIAEFEKVGVMKTMEELRDHHVCTALGSVKQFKGVGTAISAWLAPFQSRPSFVLEDAKRHPVSHLSYPNSTSGHGKHDQRLLQDSLHEDAPTAVASLLQRKRVLVAIREASRLERNKDAWDKKSSSPFGLGVSRPCLVPRLCSRDYLLFSLGPHSTTNRNDGMMPDGGLTSPEV